MRCCSHLSEISKVTPRTPNGCEECLKIGDSWVHLRLCVTCGHAGCCDDSKNTHARKHFHATTHPFMQSFESGRGLGLVLRFFSSRNRLGLTTRRKARSGRARTRGTAPL